jgi:hypothetical protein
MTDRNRSDLDREQRGASNPNQTERPESRSTKEGETDRMGGSPNRDNLGVGESQEENLGSNRESGNRSTGNIEGDENLNRR